MGGKNKIDCENIVVNYECIMMLIFLQHRYDNEICLLRSQKLNTAFISL